MFFWEFGVSFLSISILRKVCCLHTLIVWCVIGMNEIIQCFGGSFLPWTGWHDPFLNTNTLSHCITRRFACVHTYLPRVWVKKNLILIFGLGLPLFTPCSKLKKCIISFIPITQHTINVCRKYTFRTIEIDRKPTPNSQKNN